MLRTIILEIFRTLEFLIEFTIYQQINAYGMDMYFWRVPKHNNKHTDIIE